MEILAASAIAVCCLALAIQPGLRSAPEEPRVPLPQVHEQAPAPRIDVVFVLDTTGSMSGLLDGAKQKIWAIANRLASGQPRPDLRVGLVAYRDLGDDYVTRRFDFSSDMDAVYAELLSYQAGGGGDHPEHVGRGLDDALNTMQWSSGDQVLRLVFLVGDAPPHDDHADTLPTVELAARAAASGIIINTIQCGAARDTELAWRRIAAATGGEYASIAQDGGVVAVATPFDHRLSQLNYELTDTVLSYGSADDKLNSQVKLGNRMAMSESAAAEAASYSAKTARMHAEDLLGALDGGRALADIPAADLPEVMQSMSLSQQTEYIDEVRARRGALNHTIRALSAERDAYLRAAETGVGFDGAVTGALRRQADKIGVAY